MGVPFKKPQWKTYKHMVDGSNVSTCRANREYDASFLKYSPSLKISFEVDVRMIAIPIENKFLEQAMHGHVNACVWTLCATFVT